jgi:effector-binding domain-containing protein
MHRFGCPDVRDVPRVTDIRLYEQPEQDVLIIKARAKVTDLMELIGISYSKIFAYLAELGELTTDVPFVAYHNADMDDLDIHIGVPVTRPLPDKDDMVSFKMPRSKAAYCIFRGSYADTEKTYNEMHQWISDNGLKARGIVRE